MRLLWLPDVLRDAGLTVHEYAGWRTRGSESWGPLRGVVCHATAGSRSSTDAGETRVLWVTGSPSAPAPISQLYLSRSGEWTVGASGRCNHVLVGDRGPHRGFGNSHLIGVEAANDNRGEPWSPVMLGSYRRGVAALCRQMGWQASVVVAHREHQSGKSDPLGIDMGDFRAAVAARLEGDDDMDLLDRVKMADDQGDRWSFGRIMGRDSITVNAAHGYAAAGGWQIQREVAPGVAKLLAGQAALMAQLAGEDVTTAVRTELDRHREALVAELGEGLAAAVVAELAEVVGDLPADAVEAAVGRALARTSLVVAAAPE